MKMTCNLFMSLCRQMILRHTYRKPTTTDIIIPSDSCHSLDKKLAAIRYFSNRIETYNIDHRKKKEKSTHWNKYCTITNITPPFWIKSLAQKKTKTQDGHSLNWAYFKYIGKETRFITKLFKNTDVKTTFITNNNIGKLLSIQYTHKQKK